MAPSPLSNSMFILEIEVRSSARWSVGMSASTSCGASSTKPASVDFTNGSSFCTDAASSPCAVVVTMFLASCPSLGGRQQPQDEFKIKVAPGRVPETLRASGPAHENRSCPIG